MPRSENFRLFLCVELKIRHEKNWHKYTILIDLILFLSVWCSMVCVGWLCFILLCSCKLVGCLIGALIKILFLYKKILLFVCFCVIVFRYQITKYLCFCLVTLFFFSSLCTSTIEKNRTWNHRDKYKFRDFTSPFGSEEERIDLLLESKWT